MKMVYMPYLTPKKLYGGRIESSVLNEVLATFQPSAALVGNIDLLVSSNTASDD